MTDITLAQLITDNRITMKAEWADRNPGMDEDAASRMDHWRCTLRRQGKTMTVYFSQGFGHNGKEPKLDALLDCLSSDSAGVEDDFEDWASNLGYDPDSRKAEKIYNTCKRQAAKLEKFLGEEAYQTLLWNTERL